jgi:predicted HTH domain antitoxin
MWSATALLWERMRSRSASISYALLLTCITFLPPRCLRRTKQGVNPDAVLIGLEEGGLLQAPGVRAALATALFRDGELSLVRAAHVAELDVASFIADLGRLGIAAIRLTAAETNADLDTLEQWLQSSSPTPVR